MADEKCSNFISNYLYGDRQHQFWRTKIIVYQLTLVFCVVSEALGTATLSTYVHEQKAVERFDPSLSLYINDYVAVAAVNIFACVFVAFVFGAASFLDLSRPERRESRFVRKTWRRLSVMACALHLASAIAMTVVTVSRRAHIEGEGEDEEREQESIDRYLESSETPLEYGSNSRAIAAVAFAWPAFVCVVGSCILMFLSIHRAENTPISEKADIWDEQAPAHSCRHLPPQPFSDEEKTTHANITRRSNHQADGAMPTAPVTAHQTSIRSTPVTDSRLSGVQDQDNSPGLNNSEVTDASTFSALASAKRRRDAVASESPALKRQKRKTLGERSLAALTSGVGDGTWVSR